MKIVDDSPSAPHRARPAELLHRPLGAAAQPRAADAGPRAICQRRGAAAHGACRLRALAARACAGSRASTRPRRRKSPGVIAVVTGAELAKVITPWVGVLTHLKGLKSAPQHAIAVDRACWAGEAVCAVVARTPRRGRGRLRTGRGRLRGTAGGHRSGNRARSEDAGDPSVDRRQSLLRARAHRRRSRQGLRRGRRRGRDHLRVRPPHRRHQRAARHRRRLESGRSSA